MRQGAVLRIGRVLVLAIAPLCAVAAGAPGSAIVTIVEGDAVVLRDSTRFALAEGLRLRADDIVATGEGTRLVRIELADGRLVDLGPATQAMLQPQPWARAAERAPALYLLQGWAKLTNAPGTPSPAALATPRGDATRVAGTLIAAVLRDAFWLFAESGSAELWRRREGDSAPAQALKDGDSFVWRAPAGPGGVSRLPPADLRAQVPRAFVDTLPRRAARFAGAAVEPARVVDVPYAEIAPWINAEPALRAALVPRLGTRARDSAFRGALVAEMKLHPEWQPVLFPPPPKRAPRPAVAASAAAPEPEPEGDAMPLVGQLPH